MTQWQTQFFLWDRFKQIKIPSHNCLVELKRILFEIKYQKNQSSLLSKNFNETKFTV